MWERIFKFTQDLLRLNHRTERNTNDIAELQRDVEELTATVRQLVIEFNHLKETERHERENLALRLENVLLRFERRLPGSSGNDNRFLTE